MKKSSVLILFLFIFSYMAGEDSGGRKGMNETFQTQNTNKVVAGPTPVVNSNQKISFPEKFKNDSKKCYEFYTKIKEITPHIYFVSSPESKWEAKIGLETYYSWFEEAINKFKDEYPKSFQRFVDAGDFAIFINTMNQCKKYDEKYPGCLGCQSLGGSTVYGINMLVVENEKESERIKMQVLRSFMHEIGLKNSVFFSMTGRSQFIDSALNAIKKNKDLWPEKCSSLKEKTSVEYIAELFTIWFGYGISYEECLGKAEGADDAREKLKNYDKISYGLMTTLFSQSENM